MSKMPQNVLLKLELFLKIILPQNILAVPHFQNHILFVNFALSSKSYCKSVPLSSDEKGHCTVWGLAFHWRNHPRQWGPRFLRPGTLRGFFRKCFAWLFCWLHWWWLWFCPEEFAFTEGIFERAGLFCQESDHRCKRCGNFSSLAWTWNQDFWGKV